MRRLEARTRHKITIELNGAEKIGFAEPRHQLADFLRHELQMFGTHVGCEHGICGACTVLIDGEPARSCLTYAVQAEGRQVQTVEGLSSSQDLNRLQQTFSRFGALQCGFCTAGILMSTTRFLELVPDPSEEEVRDMLSGHICRCTGYQSIVDAIMAYAADTRQIDVS